MSVHAVASHRVRQPEGTNDVKETAIYIGTIPLGDFPIPARGGTAIAGLGRTGQPALVPQAALARFDAEFPNRSHALLQNKSQTAYAGC